MIGTPFEIQNDEIHNRRVAKKDRKEQDAYALDEKGRRLFHGAFTGGFHAGFNNTCGSESGFKPNKFNPSQSQNILDFMDDEDLGEYEAGQTLHAN
jgi:G patch domain-containing protein 1